MQSIKNNKILLSVFVITFIIFVYSFFFSGSTPSTVLVSDIVGQDTLVGGDVLQKFDQLKMVQIDQTLFTSTAWMSLKDMSSPLPTDVPGKNDPFSPLGSR